MFGFFNINKPVGITSHDVVASARRVLGRGVKVGHAGTLDPFADGVLVLCLGQATRLANYVQGQPKRYRTRITLAAISTTDDCEGQITPTPQAVEPKLELVSEVVSRFTGTIKQIPPAYSALHVNGRRAYKLARAGEEVNLPARDVTIHEISIVKYDYPYLDVDLKCSCGTYVRSLARDIGEALGVGGYCEKLTRTEVGDFHLDEAVDPGEIDPDRDMLSPLLALSGLVRISVDKNQIQDLVMGREITLTLKSSQGLESLGLGGEIAIVDDREQLVAIGLLDADKRIVKPRKVFVTNS